MASTDSATWNLAMDSEMHSIRANKTWDLVVKMTTLRFMLDIVAADNLELIQLNVM